MKERKKKQRQCGLGGDELKNPTVAAEGQAGGGGPPWRDCQCSLGRAPAVSQRTQMWFGAAAGHSP